MGGSDGFDGVVVMVVGVSRAPVVVIGALGGDGGRGHWGWD
jgi:hypothetical protein